MTDPTPPERIDSRPVYRGRLLRVDLETLKNPAGKTVELEMVRHPGASAVVPFVSDPDGEDPHILLLRQYRYAAGGTIWEIPAGVLEAGEDPETCARRELEEETGARAEDIRFLTSILTTPGFTDERIHLFLATGLRMEATDHEEDEHIEVQTRPLSEALSMIRDGAICDAKTIIALLYVAGFTLNR